MSSFNRARVEGLENDILYQAIDCQNDRLLIKFRLQPRDFAGPMWECYVSVYINLPIDIFFLEQSVDTKVRAWLSFAVFLPAFPSSRSNQGASFSTESLPSLGIITFEYLIHSRRHRSGWCSGWVCLEYERIIGLWWGITFISDDTSFLL